VGEAHVETVTVRDGIRGEITFPRNILDVVILKQDGLPTYHFAHTVDDHLMRTTHVIRGEEWLSSLPIHLALFEALGWTPPVYCHTALLMKIDEGVKRKLSKRKDPELALSYYIAEGYHPKAVEEYLLTILNSNYEEWRLSNPGASNAAFTLTTEKMGASGILVDLDKLRDVSRDTLAGIPANELADFITDWAVREKPDALPALQRDRVLLEAALDIGRGGEKPRKDLAYAAQIFAHIAYFFDEYFQIVDPLPEHVGTEDARTLLEGYHGTYDHNDDRETWFGKIRALAEENGYAAKPKDYKKNPELYKGHVGDVSAVIRLALTGRLEAPDIWEIQQILGEARVRGRLQAFAVI
jgi:glutamyl-tRNA synthetase